MKYILVETALKPTTTASLLASLVCTAALTHFFLRSWENVIFDQNQAVLNHSAELDSDIAVWERNETE